MKRTLLALLLSSSLLSLSRSEDQSVTATELAHHLGVSVWASKLILHDTDVQFQVFHVVNGKVATALIGGAAYGTDREFTRVSIQTSKTESGMKFTIVPETGPSGRIEHPFTIPLPVTVPLPPTLTEGDYVLGGDLPVEKITQDRPAKIEDVKNGLLLRVTKLG